MAKTIEATLGGTTYKIPMLNMGQLERVIDAIDQRKPFKVLEIALEESEPSVSAVAQIHATFPEINSAVRAVLEMSGIGPVADSD